MAASKTPRATRQHDETQFGLLANGSSGQWEIALDEAASGVGRWRVQIEGPAVTFAFAVSAPSIIREMIRFLGPRQSGSKAESNGTAERARSLSVGKDKGTPVALVRDDEYEDRFFLVAGRAGLSRRAVRDFRRGGRRDSGRIKPGPRRSR